MNIEPVFQPIKDTATDVITGVPQERLVGVEVLARWRVNGRLLTPAEISTPISWNLVDFKIIQSLIEYGPALELIFPRVFINVSPQTLSFIDIREKWLAALLQLRSMFTFSVVVEITEQITPEQLASAWPQLKTNDIKLALDDFGQEYSSFQRLVKYPWDYCKIELDLLSEYCARRAIKYCQSQSINLITERIELSIDAQLARTFGVFWHQGFYYSKPHPLNLSHKDICQKVLHP